MIERKCDWCRSQIKKPIAANGATVHIEFHGLTATRHFCEGCLNANNFLRGMMR